MRYVLKFSTMHSPNQENLLRCSCLTLQKMARGNNRVNAYACN